MRDQISTIKFTLKQLALVTLHIFNSSGVIVRTLLASQSYAGGIWPVKWDGKDKAAKLVANGTYTIRYTSLMLQAIRLLFIR